MCVSVCVCVCVSGEEDSVFFHSIYTAFMQHRNL